MFCLFLCWSPKTFRTMIPQRLSETIYLRCLKMLNLVCRSIQGHARVGCQVQIFTPAFLPCFSIGNNVSFLNIRHNQLSPVDIVNVASSDHTPTCQAVLPESNV